MKHFLFCLGFFSLFVVPNPIWAQDTLKISFPEFLQKAKKSTAQFDLTEIPVEKANIKSRQVRANRFFPKFDITSNHGIMPGVRSENGFPRDEWHLDPNLKNDWSDWSIFTRLEFAAIQPIYTWGALSNAIKASEYAANAANFKSNADEEEITLQLFQLYQSKILARDLNRIVDNAMETLEKATKEISALEEKGELLPKDVFQFKIYRERFLIKAEEAKQSLSTIDRIWSHLLGTRESIYYVPCEPKLERMVAISESIVDYESMALESRGELKAIEALNEAAELGLKAQKAQKYPSIYLGIGGEYVHTPRPTQQQPFIGNRFDYLNLLYSFGFRQSLNFSSLFAKEAAIEVQLKEARLSKQALSEGIVLEINMKYKDFITSREKLKRLNDAFQLSKEWLRTEQVDYDLGLGELKDLVDAMKTNLELEAEIKQALFDYNISVAELYKVSGVLHNQLK